jgi:hypothetical protein
MIGGLSRSATTALRQLLDAGTLANLPAGFRLVVLESGMMTNHFNQVSSEMWMHQAEILEISSNYYHLENLHKHYFN